ncbi:unnamed protein product [Sphenostylis stenocarpa]|uniref:Uncharacterized protein n=1 Tax=Sphenostylis stenocarpa TaxID=92480 RepID=A0AA86W1L8_9FABA|nr:unnamed protein product [Sphenostylis stenocarpa]
MFSPKRDSDSSPRYSLPLFHTLLLSFITFLPRMGRFALSELADYTWEMCIKQDLDT